MFMKMERKQSKSWNIALIVIISTAYPVHADLCPEEDNPFYGGNNYEIPEENDQYQGPDYGRRPAMHLAIKLVGQRYVACNVNHNNQLKEKLIMEINERRYVSQDCRDKILPTTSSFCLTWDCVVFFTWGWYDSHKNAVLENLHVIMKVKMLNLFKDNDYQEFKYAVFEYPRITDMHPDMVVKGIKSGLEYIKEGKLPHLPSSEVFENIHKIALIYEEIRFLRPFVREKFYADSLCIEDNVTSAEDCKRMITDRLLNYGGSNRKTVEKAIRFVRRYLGNNRSYDFKLPMVPPCFEGGQN